MGRWCEISTGPSGSTLCFAWYNRRQHMLYPSNSGHARTQGVRWRNVCFCCAAVFFSPALFCGCRFLLFVGGCCNRWLLQPAAVPACDSTTARSDAGWLDKHGYAAGRCQVMKMRHIDIIAGGLQQANRAAQKPKMPYTGMCNGGWERLLQTVAVSACGCFSL